MIKDKKVVEEISGKIKETFTNEFGYCGVAEGDGMVMLNSGDGNIVVKINYETEGEK
jgi:hypothetical protein